MLCLKCKVAHDTTHSKTPLFCPFELQIVHLKRFQFMNGRWIKSQKIVRFPRETFDPSAFLTPRDADQSQQSWRDGLGEELHDTEGGVPKSGGGDTVCNPTLTLNNGKGLYRILTDFRCTCHIPHIILRRLVFFYECVCLQTLCAQGGWPAPPSAETSAPTAALKVRAGGRAVGWCFPREAGTNCPSVRRAWTVAGRAPWSWRPAGRGWGWGAWEKASVTPPLVRTRPENVTTQCLS